MLILIVDTMRVTSPEYSDNPFDDIDRELAALLHDQQQQTHHNHVLRSLENEKNQILDSLVDHIMVFEDEDISNKETFRIVIETMMDAIQNDFEKNAGIDYGDDIIASGKTIALFIDRDDADLQMAARPIDDDECIRGKIEGIFLQEIPVVETLQTIIECDEVPDDSIVTNPFGIVLLLKNATAETIDGNIETIPDNYAVCIPLNYPTLRLDRIISID